ncbi:Mu transposase domain-containing protein [Actinomadura rudentiformis]
MRTNRYSVLDHLIGRTIRVKLHASGLIVYDGQAEVARHCWSRAPVGWI